MPRDLVVHCDFETYSEVDLTEVGSFRYAEDPTTEALILGYSIGKSAPKAVDLTAPGALSKLTPLFEAIRKGARVTAHNVTFERNIWTKVCKFPVTPREDQWDCTAVRSRLLAMPGSLDGCAAALGLEIRKDPRGQELIKIFCKPGKKGRVRPVDMPLAFQEFMEYCKQDVRVEMEIDEILPPIPDVEREAFLLDYRINDRGMPVNLPAVNRAIAFVEEYSAKIEAEAVAISNCRPTQREKTLEFLRSRGFAMPNLQRGTVEEMAQRKDLPLDVQTLLAHRVELSRAGTKKLVTIRACASEDGRIRGGFLFSAASTRRWSSVGVQMHNLQKPESKEANPDVVLDMLEADCAGFLPTLFSSPLTAVAESIRGFFQSETGFHVADFASIEPRGLAWSADEEWLLKAYWNKEDAYKIAAGKVFGIDPSKVNAEQRFLGKQLILGCGYGMGPPRFIESCRKFGVDISLNLAESSVYGYRDSVPNIVQFWKTIEACAIKAVKYWRDIPFGRFKFRPITLSNGYPILMLDMPSGSIAYPKPAVAYEEWYGAQRPKLEFYSVLGSTFHKTDTFGGSLTENVIQALTRDLLRDGMVKADKQGHYLIGHCHDEAIAENDTGKEGLRAFEDALCTASDWADGIPIVTEGYVANRYKK